MKYKIETLSEKKVADYAGISVFDVGELNYYDYRILLRDAVIHELMQTKSGRDYLNECWIFEQTKPDRKSLRKNFGDNRKEVSEDGGER